MQVLAPDPEHLAFFVLSVPHGCLNDGPHCCRCPGPLHGRQAAFDVGGDPIRSGYCSNGGFADGGGATGDHGSSFPDRRWITPQPMAGHGPIRSNTRQYLPDVNTCRHSGECSMPDATKEVMLTGSMLSKTTY
jgi:hypothetical protein